MKIIEAFLWLPQDEYDFLIQTGMTDVEIKAMASNAFKLAALIKIENLRLSKTDEKSEKAAS